MPIVPKYGAPKVGPSPTPTSRVPTSAPEGTFGGGQGPYQQAQGLAGDVEKRLLEEKQKADTIVTQRAYTALVKRRNALYYGQDGVASRVGVRAAGVHQEFVPAFDQASKEIEDSLADDDQREVFRRMADQERREFDGMIVRHEKAERERVEDETFGAILETSIDDMVKNYDLPGKGARTKAVIGGSIMARAADRGWSPEQTKAVFEGTVSKMHTQVIARMLSLDQDQQAMAYYAANKAEIGGADSARVEGALQEGSTRGDSMRKADMIYSAADTLKDALGLADSIEDAKTRDMTKARLRERFRDDDVAAEQEQAGLYDKALKQLQQYPGVNPRLALSPDDWKRLDPKYQDALLKRQEAPAATDAQTWLDFVQALKDDPASVAAMSRAEFEREYWSKFDRQDRARAEAIWAERGNAKKQEEFKSLYSEQEAVIKAFISSGAGGTPGKIYGFGQGASLKDTAKTIEKDEKKREALSRFRHEADDAFKGFFHATGKNPNDEEKQQILDRLSQSWAKKIAFKRYDMGIDWLDADEQRMVGDITEDDIASEEFDVPAERKQAYYLLARSVGRIPQTEDSATFFKNNQKLVNMAWLSEQKGVSDKGLRGIIENWGK